MEKVKDISASRRFPISYENNPNEGTVRGWRGGCRDVVGSDVGGVGSILKKQMKVIWIVIRL